MKTQGTIEDINLQEPLKEVKVVEPEKTSKPEVEEKEEDKKKEPEEEKNTTGEPEEEEKESEEKIEPEVDWKAKAEKLEKERNNYKEALLIAKGKTLSLGGKNTEEDKSKWDETSDEFQKETLTKVEKLVEERLGKVNERGAINRFLKKHPSVVTKGGWNDIVESYKPTRGRETADDILEDLEDAYLVSKRKNGTLKEDFEQAKLEGERKGVVKATTAKMASVSGAGNHSVKKTDSKKGLSDNARYMAKMMKTPIDKLEALEEDSNTVVINNI